MLAIGEFADIPWAALTPFILAFVVGVVLCFAGRRVMRIAFTGVGLIAGAAGGWVLTQAIDLPVPDWAVIIVPAIVLAALASLAYKLTIAVVMALVLGVACPLALVTAGDVGLYEMPDVEETEAATEPEAEPDDTANESITLPEGLGDLELPPDVTEWLRDLANKEAGEAANEFFGLDGAADETAAGEESAGAEDDESDAVALDLSPEQQAQIDRATAFVRELYDTARARWDDFPQSLRYNLLLSAAIGALLGLLLGALAPTFSASVASSGAGSAICLATASIVAARLGAAETAWLPDSAGVWLVLWLVVAIIGLTIQWTTRPKPVDNAR